MVDLFKLVESVKDGETSPLEAYGIIKSVMIDAKEALDYVMEQALEESDKFNENSFEQFGYKFTKVPARRNYDFSSIPEWVEANRFIKEMEAKFKQAASAYEKGTRLFDEQTGEQIPIPGVKHSQPSISVTRIVSPVY